MLLNLVHGELHLVGTIDDGKYSPTGVAITFPGGVLSAPEDMPPVIEFSWFGKDAKQINGVLSTSFGVPSVFGGELALTEITSSQTVLPGWELHYNEMNFGVLLFYPPLADPVFAMNLDRLGSLMYGVIVTEMAYGVMSLEAKYNVLLPKIFTVPAHSELGNPEVAPLFNRIATDSQHWA
jgi:hypothetical protein